jgi:hypothetical protein
MSERIFVRTPEFQAGIAALNQLAEAETEPVNVFVSLLQSEAKAEKKNELMVSTLAAILDRVAYFPLRPSDMQVNSFNKFTVRTLSLGILIVKNFCKGTVFWSYTAHFLLFERSWIRTQRAAAASWRCKLCFTSPFYFS